MHKKDRKTPEEIARDLEEVVLPEISEEDLEDTYGGSSGFEEISNTNCGCGC